MNLHLSFAFSTPMVMFFPFFFFFSYFLLHSIDEMFYENILFTAQKIRKNGNRTKKAERMGRKKMTASNEWTMKVFSMLLSDVFGFCLRFHVCFCAIWHDFVRLVIDIRVMHTHSTVECFVLSIFIPPFEHCTCR